MGLLKSLMPEKKPLLYSPLLVYDHVVSGKLIELPRRLEWKSVEYWDGTVAGTGLKASVMSIGNASFNWAAWNNGILVDMGTAASLEAGKEAARIALEKNVVVLRALPKQEGA